jgi:hypothetical protein
MAELDKIPGTTALTPTKSGLDRQRRAPTRPPPSGKLRDGKKRPPGGQGGRIDTYA